jgi:hypothetical protein
MSDLAYASATELLQLMNRRELTSRQLLELYLDRVERFNGDVNAVVYFEIDAALDRADRADKARAAGERWGVLHGLPMTVKETNHVAGWLTNYGDLADADWRSQKNSASIDRLVNAGAIIFGRPIFRSMPPIINPSTRSTVQREIHGICRGRLADRLEGQPQHLRRGSHPSSSAAISPGRSAFRLISAEFLATSQRTEFCPRKVTFVAVLGQGVIL